VPVKLPLRLALGSRSRSHHTKFEVFVSYLSTAKPVDLLPFCLARLHWLRPKPFQTVEIASPPGVELALEPLEAFEGEAKSRFRGSIWLRLIGPPFSAFALEWGRGVSRAEWRQPVVGGRRGAGWRRQRGRTEAEEETAG
jgi:hypothetical protein